MTDQKLVVYLTRWCGECLRATRYLTAWGIPFETVNIDQNPEADQFVRRTNHGYRSVPTIVFPDGSVLVEPSEKALAEKVAALTKT